MMSHKDPVLPYGEVINAVAAKAQDQEDEMKGGNRMAVTKHKKIIYKLTIFLTITINNSTTT